MAPVARAGAASEFFLDGVFGILPISVRFEEWVRCAPERHHGGADKRAEPQQVAINAHNGIQNGENIERIVERDLLGGGDNIGIELLHTLAELALVLPFAKDEDLGVA